MSLLATIVESDFRSVVIADGGLSLSWQPPTGSPVSFKAIVDVKEPEKDPFASQPSSDVIAMIKALRSDFGNALPRSQDVFSGEGGVRYQIQNVRNLHGTPFINFRAKVIP